MKWKYYHKMDNVDEIMELMDSNGDTDKLEAMEIVTTSPAVFFALQTAYTGKKPYVITRLAKLYMKIMATKVKQ